VSPSGRRATILNLTTGLTVQTALFAGGFDPVPIGANVGDSLAVSVVDDQGATVLQAVLPVMAAQPPIVVRTEPPHKKTDVPLNAALLVVFSEPIAPASLTTASVQLLQGGAPVSGTVRFLDSTYTSAQFIPALSLAPATVYQLIVTTGIHDLDNKALTTPVVVDFTSGDGLVGPAASVVVAPSAATLFVGWTLQLGVAARDSAGNTLNGVVSWAGTNRATSVSPSGSVTAAALGTDTVTATVHGLSSRAIISVVSPAAFTVTGRWDYAQTMGPGCTTQGTFDFSQRSNAYICGNTDPNSRPVVDLQLGVIPGSDGARVWVDFFDTDYWVRANLGFYCEWYGTSTGTPPALLNGTVRCSGTTGAYSGTWTAAPAGPLGSVVVSRRGSTGARPGALAVNLGDSLSLIAELRDTLGRRVFLRPVTWASDRPSVVAVAPSGMMTVRDTGVATISAIADGTTGTVRVIGFIGPATVKVFPANDTIASGTAVRFSATTADARGKQLDGVGIIWWSGAPSVATVSATGLATGVAAGTTWINGAVDATNASAEVKLTVVGNPVTIGGQWHFAETWYGGNYDEYPYYLCDDTGSVTLTQVGLTFTGTEQRAGNCPNQSPFPVTGGVVNGRQAGFTMGCGYSIQVQGNLADRMIGSASGCPDSNTYVTSFNAVRVGATASITVQPAGASLVPGDAVSLSAVLRDAAGDTLTLLPISWSSDNPAVATVAPSGRVTSVGPGTATVSATADGRSASATITVRTVSFTSVSAGFGQTCGVTVDGASFCWGYGASFPRSLPGTAQDGPVFAAVSVGWDHSCLLTTQAVAYCWGGNEYGNVGNPASQYYATPVPVAGGQTFAQVSAAVGYTCGATTGGVAYCWGRNDFGGLGVGRATGPELCSGVPCSTAPVAVTGLSATTTVSAAGYHTCALASGGQAYCWGRDDSGELGIGTATGSALCLGNISCSPSPVAVAGDLRFTGVSAGGSHTCGLASDGTAYCWGLNYAGQLGTGSAAGPEICFAGTPAIPCSTRPAAIGGGLVFASVSAGASHTCAVTTAGNAYCWGDNSRGQLGTGSVGGPQSCTHDPNPAFPCSTSPAAVVGGLRFASVSAGGDYTCGITTSGVTYCWGSNDRGQLGSGLTVDSPVPIKVAGQP
jgi:uncharacterized protein YjdB